jgi:hypothetical protein
VRRRLFHSKTFTEIGTQTGPDAAEAEAEADLKCSICLEQTEKKNVTITECGHKFCTSCLLKHLAVRNTCPNCRTEIESARAPAIEPLNATIVSNIIREEETTIDMTRRIAVIGAFQDAEGRAAMILSLARELAFGSGHSMAGWQGTSDDTYHASWSAYEYNGIDDDDDDEDDEDDEDEDDEGESEESDDDGVAHDGVAHDGVAHDDDDDASDASEAGVNIDELLANVIPINVTPIRIPASRQLSTPISPIRSPFQSPRFQRLTMDIQPTWQQVPAVSVMAPIEAVSIEPVAVISRAVNSRTREIDYFDLIVGNVIRVTLFAFVLFVYSR